MAILVGHLHQAVADDGAVAVHHGDATLLQQAGQAAGHGVHHAVLIILELLVVDVGRLDIDAHGGPKAGLFENLGGGQQGLGGDASPVQADAANHRVLLDQSHPSAQLCRAQGRGIAAWAGSDNDGVVLAAVGIPWVKRLCAGLVDRLLHNNPC